jgi:hypothetical protein
VFDPKKAMSVLSQMPMLSPMLMGGGFGSTRSVGIPSGSGRGLAAGMPPLALNPLGGMGMPKVASMPNVLTGVDKR